jgi:hypothetical protein
MCLDNSGKRHIEPRGQSQQYAILVQYGGGPGLSTRALPCSTAVLENLRSEWSHKKINAGTLAVELYPSRLPRQDQSKSWPVQCTLM